MRERDPIASRRRHVLIGATLGFAALTGVAYGIEAVVEHGAPSRVVLLADLVILAAAGSRAPWVADYFVPSPPCPDENAKQA